MVAKKAAPKPPVDTPFLPADLKARIEELAAQNGIRPEDYIAAALRAHIADIDRGRRF